jgi:hypothetical protein
MMLQEKLNNWELVIMILQLARESLTIKKT